MSDQDGAFYWLPQPPQERVPMTPEEYVEHIALAFLASPDELCEPGEEGGDLYGVLCLACDRVGIDPQDVIDGVLAKHGRPVVEVAP